MARLLNRALEGMSPIRNGVYVVRMHSVKTEVRIFLSDAKAERRKRIAATKGFQMPEDQDGNSNDTIATHFRAHATGKYEATDDDRLQEIELSVGTHMRKNLSRASIELQELYKQYAQGDALDSEKHAHLWEMAIDFLRSTIRDSTAICCTVAGAFDHDVHESFEGAEMVVVDEAARVMEYQLWPLFAFYKHARGKIMVGDPNQLGPSGPRREDRNPFGRQMELSLQTRLQDQHFPTAFFDVQYRVVPEIATIFNDTCYSSRLQSDVTTGVDNRPLAQAIRRHNKLHYNVEHSVVFFNVKGSREELYRGRPKYCDEYITTVSEIVEDLLMAGFGQQKHPCTIAILTTYKLEQKRLKHTWTKILQSELFDVNATVVVETVDKAQGMEYDIAIVDPVVVDSAGFLTSNRLNVLFSRARNGLYVVGDRTRWERMFQEGYSGKRPSRGTVALRSFATELWRDNSYVVSWPQKEWLGGRRAQYYEPEEFHDGW